MRNTFVKGMMVGGIVAASVGLVMNTDMMSGRTKKRMIKGGRNLLRKSSGIIGDVADLFR